MKQDEPVKRRKKYLKNEAGRACEKKKEIPVKGSRRYL